MKEGELIVVDPGKIFRDLQEAYRAMTVSAEEAAKAFREAGRIANGLPLIEEGGDK